MKYVLECNCGSVEFEYNGKRKFICSDCGQEYDEEEAGLNLIELTIEE